jgi:hypothetical protein
MVSDPLVKILGQTMRLLQNRLEQNFLASEAADRKVIFRKAR